MVEWCVHGCGSPSSGRWLQSSYEFIDKKTRIQFDFGNGALHQRCRSEKSFVRAMDSIHDIFFTHGHPDHLADLGRLFVAWKWTPGYQPSSQINLHGTKQTLRMLKTLFNATRLEGSFEDAFQLHEVKMDQTILIDSVEITPVTVQHIDGAVGYRIVAPSGKQIVYTGDTGYFEALGEAFAGVDLLVMETSFIKRRTPFHLDLDQAAKVAGLVDPEMLVLVHFYPEMENIAVKDIRKTVKKYYNGTMHAAHDGMALKWVAKSKTWVKRSLF